MTMVRQMPVLAAAMFAAACGGDDGPTGADTRPSVRFANLTTGLTGSGGFTVNGQFVAGSALASGQVAQTCSKLDATGSTSFGFGAANAGGTGLSGSELATLTDPNIMTGGDYGVVAAGSATSPVMFLLTNSFSGELSTTQSAVRFISLAQGTGTTVPNYVFYRGEIGATSPLALNLPFGVTSGYTVVPSGASTFSAMQTPGNVILVPSSAITLQAGSVNTIALVRNASGGFQLVHLPRCG